MSRYPDIHRRSDGSIITSDCPIGLRAIQQRVSYLVKAILAATFTFLASIGVQTLIADFPVGGSQRTLGVIAVREAIESPPVLPQPAPLMGKVMIRPPQHNSRNPK